MYHNWSRLSEIESHMLYILISEISLSPYQKGELHQSPAGCRVNTQRQSHICSLGYLESLVHQPHVIVMWEEAGGTRKLHRKEP